MNGKTFDIWEYWVTTRSLLLQAIQGHVFRHLKYDTTVDSGYLQLPGTRIKWHEITVAWNEIS